MRLLIEGLTVLRGERAVLNGLDLAIDAGTCAIIRGPNGAGKSTLLRAIAGLLKPQSGSIRLDGGRADTDIGQQAHFLGHANGMRRGQDVESALGFWAGFLGDPSRRAGIGAVLERVGIGALADVPVGRLSAGQQRRAALARLLIAPRPVWLLDEPTVALDGEGRALVELMVSDHVATGGIALLTTHVPITIAQARMFDLAAGGAAE